MSTHTERPSEVHQPQESHASHGPSTTPLPPLTHGDTPSLPSLQFCPPGLYLSLAGNFWNVVETALQTGETQGNSVGTRQQMTTLLEARPQGLLRHCGSHTHMAAISCCLSSRRAVTERRLRHERTLLMLRLWEITLEILWWTQKILCHDRMNGSGGHDRTLTGVSTCVPVVEAVLPMFNFIRMTTLVTDL